MKSIIILLLLFGLYISSSKVENPEVALDIYKGHKSKIYKCISETKGISTLLKELSISKINADENLPLDFLSIKLTKVDRLAIKNCKKVVFRKN